VYAQLCYLSEVSGSCLINEDELTESCGISKTQYRKALSFLTKQGLLEKDGTNYSFTEPSEWGKSKTQDRQKVAGYAYLAQSGLQFKIGKSRNPQKRILQLSTASAHLITLVCSIATDDMTATESELHQRFADKRIRGEWFALSPDDVEAIKAMEG
jgi:hypothetical protein